MVKELLNHNADIEAKDNDGCTPLICGIFQSIYLIWKIIILFFSAARSGHIEVVKELLNRNADIEVKDKDGNTALILGIVLFIL